MDQHLHGLFARALHGEPLPPPADLARSAMEHGTTLRRRRRLRNSGIAGGALVAALLTLNLVVPAGDSAPSPEPATLPALGALPAPSASPCAAQTDVAIFLRPDVTGEQRAAVGARLGGDPRIRWYSYESHEQAFQKFVELWHDSPDFPKNVSPTQLPEAYRVGLTTASESQTFAAEMRRRPRVQAVAPDGCRLTTGPGRTGGAPAGSTAGATK